MLRNVEIKAKVLNINKIRELARKLSGKDPEVLRQDDTFFQVSKGRLKLRKLQGETSQLIYYNRPDTQGPKISEYSICPVSNPEELQSLLSTALGQKGAVRKVRYLYLYGQTRIHIDQVEGLGDFMELEVVLTPEQTLEQGQEIAEDIRIKLEVDTEDLLSGAYLDQLEKQ